MTLQNLGRMLWTGVKLGATGATVAGLAFAFGVFDAELEVAESQADIFALDFADATPRAKFVAALDQMGHSKPRAFDLNGNLVFFSSRQTQDEPFDVMEQYQREFVNQGLNDDMYLKLDDDTRDKMMVTGLTGGMVPMYVTPDYIMLGGMETAQPASTASELKGLNKTLDKSRPYELFKSYKTVEIMKTPGDTLVSASWSDEEFDYEKMYIDSKSDDRNVSLEVPACPGCQRVTAFQDLNGMNFRNDVFIGDSSPQHLSRFYNQALTARGWELTPASRALEKVKLHADFKGDDAILQQYARGAEFMTVLTHKDSEEAHSVVHTVQSN